MASVFKEFFCLSFSHSCPHFPPLLSPTLPMPHLLHAILPLFVHGSFIHVPGQPFPFFLSWYSSPLPSDYKCIGTTKGKTKKWNLLIKNCVLENQDGGGVGRHTAPPRTTRTDGKSNCKKVRHQVNKK